MTTLLPNTTALQSFKLRVRETGSQTPFSVIVELDNEFTYVSASYSVTSSFTDDWLYITGSFPLAQNQFYSINANQYVGGTFVKELYRGEIYATTASAIILDTEPMFGYVASASVNEYITY